MPDGDYLRYSLTARWRKVLYSLQHQDTSARIEDLTVKALAATLRAGGGVPDLQRKAAAVHQAWSSNDPLATYLASRSTVPRDVLSRLADQVALTMASNMQRSFELVSPLSAAQLVARKVLERVARHAGFDRMVPYLVGEGMYSAPELNNLINGILQGNQMDKLAKSFAHHTDGEGLRAPRKISPSRSLDELMYANLEDL